MEDSRLRAMFAPALACLAVFSLAGASAFAQETQPAQPEKPAHSWTRLYVGGHLGYLDGSARRSDEGDDVVGFTFRNIDDIAGGGFVGLDFNLGGFAGDPGNIVLGVEADYSIFRDDETFVGTAVGGGTNSFNLAINDLYTARARLGYTVKDVLLYATGGYAGTSAKLTDIGFGRDRRLLHGYAVGGGVESQAFELKDFSIRAELLYVDFGEKTFFAGSVPDQVDPQAIIARIGFAWELPVFD